jgi:hypothetical protein
MMYSKGQRVPSYPTVLIDSTVSSEDGFFTTPSSSDIELNMLRDVDDRIVGGAADQRELLSSPNWFEGEQCLFRGCFRFRFFVDESEISDGSFLSTVASRTALGRHHCEPDGIYPARKSSKAFATSGWIYSP